MAEFRGLTIQAGTLTQIQDPDTLIVGNGIDTDSPFTLLVGQANADRIIIGNSANNFVDVDKLSGQLEISSTSDIRIGANGTVSNIMIIGNSSIPNVQIAGDSMLVTAQNSYVVTSGGLTAFESDSQGRVGIGGSPATNMGIAALTSPESQLYVFSKIGAQTGGTYGTLRNDPVPAIQEVAVTSAFSISIITDGRIISGDEISSYSDEREKIDLGILASDVALAAITKLPIHQYQWKHKEDKRPKVGVFAQQLGPIVPEAVTVMAGTLARGTEDESHVNDAHYVDWNQMTAVAIAAIQELTKKVAQLQDEVNTLKSR